MRSVTQKQGRRAPGKSANKMPAWGKCAAASARQPAAAAQTARGPSPPHEGSAYHPSELDTKCSWPGAVLQKRRKLRGAAGESAAGNPSGAGPGRDWDCSAGRRGGAGPLQETPRLQAHRVCSRAAETREAHAFERGTRKR